MEDEIFCPKCGADEDDLVFNEEIQCLCCNHSWLNYFK